MLDVGGEYALRIRGEDHVWNTDTVRDLQHAVRANTFETYESYAEQINEQDKKLMTLKIMKLFIIFSLNWNDNFKFYS